MTTKFVVAVLAVLFIVEEMIVFVNCDVKGDDVGCAGKCDFNGVDPNPTCSKCCTEKDKKRFYGAIVMCVLVGAKTKFGCKYWSSFI